MTSLREFQKAMEQNAKLVARLYPSTARFMATSSAEDWKGMRGYEVRDETHVWETKDSGERAHFEGGGQRDSESGKPRFDLLLPQAVPYEHQMLTRWADLMGRGAEKYDARNWELFADDAALERARSSAFRHFMQWINGEQDEDHAAAVFFNIMATEYIEGKLAGKW